MTGKLRSGIIMLVLVVVLAISAVPAFADPCLNPQGEANGWEPCSACCDNPRGAANGWVYCDGGCCRIPRGQINGWVPCGQ